MKSKAIVISIVIMINSHCNALHSKRKTNKQGVAEKSFAAGAGIFLHDESGVTHTHYFDFSIFERKNGPEGSFQPGLPRRKTNTNDNKKQRHNKF